MEKITIMLSWVTPNESDFKCPFMFVHDVNFIQKYIIKILTIYTLSDFVHTLTNFINVFGLFGKNIVVFFLFPKLFVSFIHEILDQNPLQVHQCILNTCCENDWDCSSK